ncbi:MAG: hypothetical protein RLZZ241_2237 [Bacteroidota bacterium]|jgi:oligopeptidase B
MARPLPPLAQKIQHRHEMHGHVRNDSYYWMRDREADSVLEHLRAENSYYQEMTAHTLEFQETLFQEMKSRIKEDDESVPYKLNGYWYITRYELGSEYPIYTRKKESLQAPEEVLFDGNQMAKGYDYFDLRGIAISPNNRLAAFGVDTVSRRQYRIQIKDLQTGVCFDEILEDTTGSTIWAADNKTLFYTKKDVDTLRSVQIYRHVLGTPVSEDVVVYEEEDETFNCYVYKSKSKKYIIIGSSSTLTTEYRILAANDPLGDFEIFSPRERGIEYSLYHYGESFYILTNKDGATNFKLMRTSERLTHSDYWEEFIPHRATVLLEDVEIFSDYLVVEERENGLNRIQIKRWDGGDSYYLPFNSETYVAYGYVNPDYDTHWFRYVYNAMNTPYSVLEFNMLTRESRMLKQQEVLGGNFIPENYNSKRVWAQARDGVSIPISLVYHKDTALDGSAPLLQYGYGAYGNTTDPYFSTIRLSLLDRGFIYAIAHVRGGEYLGRNWYNEGKLLKKQNTFTDFIDCSRFLIQEKFTQANKLFAYGGSAGGLLIGAVINMEPNLYCGVLAAVPFVDVVTTMLDESIPLTTGEYDEWGDPRDQMYFEYMLAYSPYDNVRQQEYPHMLVITGLHDSQVQYWEPAKWVAKLRELKTDNNKLLLYTNMEAGHGGASGRFESLRETAMEYAFILDLAGKIS